MISSGASASNVDSHSERDLQWIGRPARCPPQCCVGRDASAVIPKPARYYGWRSVGPAVESRFSPRSMRKVLRATR